MNRGKYSKPIDCCECGAPIKMFEDFDYCGKCTNPIHVGCAKWQGSEYVCSECEETNDSC